MHSNRTSSSTQGRFRVEEATIGPEVSPWLCPPFPASCPFRFSVTERDRLPQASGMVARTGLRMMPTSPPPPLSFRTAGFPSVRLEGVHIRWDLPDGFLAEACSQRTRVNFQFVATLRACEPPFLSSSESGKVGQHRHRKIGPGQPAPQGSSLRSGLFCPSPSSLNRPHPPHSQARSDFAADSSILPRP
jgi:hypothetical protein